MRKLALLALLALGLPASAQAARVEGKVVNTARPEAASGVEVVLIGQDVGPDGKPAFNNTTVKTDAQGRFVFEKVKAPAGYLTRARYGEILQPGPTVELKSEDATETIEIPIHERTDDASKVELQGTIVYVEPEDAGVWGFGIVMGIVNNGDKVVMTPESGKAALSVALPLGHGEPQAQSSSGPLEIVTQDASVGVRGPIFPGPQQVDVYYPLDTGGRDLATELEFSQDTPQAIVLVVDNSVAVSAGDLHPAPPVRVQGKIYQQYLGFDVPAGTRVPLRVTPIPGRGKTPALVRALTLSVPFALFALFVLMPIAQVRRGRVLIEGDEAPSQQQALLAALADLEHDYEMGKVSEEDRDRMRAELRAETLRELARESAVAAVPAAPRAAERKVCECGKQPSAGDRFCSNCGRAL